MQKQYKGFVAEKVDNKVLNADQVNDDVQVKSDPVLYAHANRILHLETNLGNARAGSTRPEVSQLAIKIRR